MASNLLNRSLSEIARQDRDKMRSGGGRSSPYARNPAPSGAPDEGKWTHDMFEGRAGARAPGRVPDAGPSPKLRIEGLHYEVSEQELRELFARIGPVQKAYIKYDKSGRSTGAAIVQYDTTGHAVAAKREYDGANAKGQPISIFFEPFKAHVPPPRAPAAMTAQQGGGRGGAKGGADLLSRLSGPDLAGRIGGGRGGAPPPNAPRGPAAQQQQRPGPHRSASGGGGPVRGGAGASRGGGRGGRGGAKAEARRAPATANDLDKELEDFMKAPPSKEAAKSIHAPKDAQGDTEMA